MQPWWKNSRGEWYVVLQVVLIVAVAAAPLVFGAKPDLPGGWHTAALLFGGFLGGIGLVLMVAGLLALGRYLSPLPHPVDGAPLIEDGVYGLVRHPIYSGLVIATVGWAVLNISLITLACGLVLFVFFDIKSRREERWLVREYAQYAAYQRRVHKLIPFVY